MRGILKTSPPLAILLSTGGRHKGAGGAQLSLKTNSLEPDQTTSHAILCTCESVRHGSKFKIHTSQYLFSQTYAHMPTWSKYHLSMRNPTMTSIKVHACAHTYTHIHPSHEQNHYLSMHAGACTMKSQVNIGIAW